MAFEQMLMMSSTEDYREQLREWREDGGRHSDEVSRVPKQIYLETTQSVFLPNFAKFANLSLRFVFF